MNFPPESGSPLLEKPSSFRFQLVYLHYVTCNDHVCMMIDVCIVTCIYFTLLGLRKDKLYRRYSVKKFLLYCIRQVRTGSK